MHFLGLRGKQNGYGKASPTHRILRAALAGPLSDRTAAGRGSRCALGRYGVPFRRLCAADV
jgi:hypothetical protein